MDMYDKVFNEVKEIISNVLALEDCDWKVFPKYELGKQNLSNLITDFGGDSLDGVEILLKLEKKYGLQINDNQAENFTLDDLVVFIMRSTKLIDECIIDDDERIICSAIWINTDKKDESHCYITPGAKNYKESTGIIITGLSHADCIRLISNNEELKKYIPLNHSNSVQGFITSSRRFVDRYNAFVIALKRHQISESSVEGRSILYSEDLY